MHIWYRSNKIFMVQSLLNKTINSISDLNMIGRKNIMQIPRKDFQKRNLMVKEIFVGIRVVHLNLQNYTTTLLLRRFLQSNMELKNSSFIFLGITSWQKWICLPSLKCFSSKGKCFHAPSYSDGQIDFHSGPSKSSTSKEEITLSLIIFPESLQSSIPQFFLPPYVYTLLQILPHHQILLLQFLVISLI